MAVKNEILLLPDTETGRKGLKISGRLKKKSIIAIK